MVSFDGPLGGLAALVMAWLNADAEAAAVGRLAPSAGEDVLVIGFGPGVGLRLLSGLAGIGRVAGIDPSQAMLDHARRRNRDACERGTMQLRLGAADALPWPDRSFDGVVAVNSMQLWSPLPASLAEVARVLRPGGRLISSTHEWAIRRHSAYSEHGANSEHGAHSEHGASADWLREVTALCAACGLAEVATSRESVRSGSSIVLTARRILASYG
jgi:SAM-dependent methyltransferase